jgi:hypothetical protein
MRRTRLARISEDLAQIKVVHTYGVGLHTDDAEPNFDDAR